MLLGQVQFIAITSQYNVDLPSACMTFSSGFAWANLQIPSLLDPLFANADETIDSYNLTDYNLTTFNHTDTFGMDSKNSAATARSRRRLEAKRHVGRRMSRRAARHLGVETPTEEESGSLSQCILNTQATG